MRSLPTNAPDAAVALSSLAGVAALGLVGYAASLRLLPRAASATTRWTFVWLAFDGLIHGESLAKPTHR